MKEIKFNKRTVQNLYQSFTNLKNRYKTVELHSTLSCGNFYGYFLVK